LVVEDAEEVRELLVFVLEREGFSVASRADADQAFAQVQRDRPDLVLTDLMLGASSGLDLITRIRSDLGPPIPPILVCSGFTTFEGEALQRGAAAFIPKPFDPSTILDAVRAVLATRSLADDERDRAEARSRSLRAQAIEAASAATRRLAPRWQDVARRSLWTTEFLPRYFGFGEAFYTLVEGDRLKVSASSNEQAWKRGQVLDLPLCTDILETSSALVVPNLQALGAAAPAPDGRMLRFFAGVPLANGPVTVGALCFVDDEPRRFGSDGFSVLEAFARRASAILSADESQLGPAWTPSGLLTRETLLVLLAAELARMVREPLWLGLLVFAGRAPAMPVAARTAHAELGEHHCAVLFTRGSDAEARRTLLVLLREAASTGDFAGAGLVSIEGGTETPFDARVILRAAEGLLERALRSRPGTVERIVIRHELLTLRAAELREP
jgi:CheY-like chemotaxis protein